MVSLSELAVVSSDTRTVVATVDEEGGDGDGIDGDGDVDSDDGNGDDDDHDGKGNGNDEDEDGDGIKGDVAVGSSAGSVGSSDNIVVDGRGVSETML